jgi:membrane associated rhomboid family serine protease
MNLLDTPITLVLIAVTCFVSYQAFLNTEMKMKMLFRPYLVQHSGEWYRFISHGLIHADWNHLIFNMITLYFFGSMVEIIFSHHFGTVGLLLYVALYILGMIAAAMPAYIKHRDHSYYASLGASGATSAVLFASILFAPWNGIMLLFIPIPIPAFIFGVLYLGISSYLSRLGNDNIAHDAHFYGAVFGFFFPAIFDWRLLQYFVEQIAQGAPGGFGF